uniref:OTU domain-containing protein n=1 Tax=Solanum tuberosum TaxID=4113 RepID=M1D7U3_SOLTU
MAKMKHQKSKPNKQSHAKKHGKQTDISEFRAQLDALGLKIIQVTADGNCFFRALGDQLEGNEEEHEKYRAMTVKFIRNNRDTFEPFIEDDVPFDEYCESMEKDGTWAGHMELQAASLVTHTNICIHRHMSPRWYIQNFDNRESRMLHLSYHDGEHYNSIRLREDSCTGPASPIIIKADADLSAKSRESIAAAKSKGDTSRNMVPVGSVKMVMAGSGCDNKQKVEQVLRQVGGDVDAAIEFLIAEQGSEDQLNANDNISSLASTSQGNGKSVLFHLLLK